MCVCAESFIMNLHHSGDFGEWGYFNGEVHKEEFDIDEISLVRIDLVAQDLGLFGNLMYYWRDPKKDFNSGLKILENDGSVFEMALNAADVGEIDVYVRHLSEDDLDKAMNVGEKSGVVIEELIAEGEFESNVRSAAVNEVGDSVVNTMVIEDVEFDGIVYMGDGDDEAELNSKPEAEPEHNDDAGDQEDAENEDSFGAAGDQQAEPVVEHDQQADLNEIGQTDFVQSEKEKANDFVDPDYDIVNGDEDLISILRETGQLKSRGRSGEGGGQAEGGHKTCGRPKSVGVQIDTGGVNATMTCEENDVLSDYGASDELNTASESEGEDHTLKKKRQRFPSFNAEKDMEDPTFVIGLLFRHK